MDTPWIKFAVDLTQMRPSFWMLLGEARSKCLHLAAVPVSPEYADQLHEINLSKGVHATTAIEGNTLTETEILELVRQRSNTDDLNYQEREVRNVVDAYNDILAHIPRGEIPKLSPDLIKKFNRQILEGLELPDEVTPGKYRKHSVVVGPYKGPDADKCDELIRKLCDWLNGPDFKSSDPSMRIPNAILKASIVHLYIAWIHPFGDGNGRTARLCEYLVLVTSRVPTSAAHLISNYCNKTRSEYYRQLDYSSKSGGDVEKFLEYCLKGFIEGLEEQLELIYEYQFRIQWRDLVNENVTGRDRVVRERRALLAESLFVREPIFQNEIKNLSPELARLYANRTDKTLSRDLNELVKQKLLLEGEDGFRANVDLLLALLPLTSTSDFPQ